MAERILYFARASLKRSITITTTTTPKRSNLYSVFFTKHLLNTSAIQPLEEAGGEEEEEEEAETKSNKGKWVTLPPFTSTVDPTSVGKRLSNPPPSNRSREAKATTALKWVLRCCPHLPRVLVQKLFRLRQVRRETCEGTSEEGQKLKRVSAHEEIKLGDRIFLPITVKELPSKKLFREKPECHCNEDEISYLKSLELYKDAAILVVNKPHGMPVQGGTGITNSLDELAGSYLKFDYKEQPRLVHRLDRDSSGILVLGRTLTSATILHSIFREKTFGAETDDPANARRILERRYWALVIGTPRHTKGLISAPLGKLHWFPFVVGSKYDKSPQTRFLSTVILDNGKSERITVVDDNQSIPSQHAITEYRLLDSPHQGYTWLELCPLTGRKHQLRVHCAEVLGTPIVGDYKYGWQAHRKWNPVELSELELNENLTKPKMLPFGLDLESGSITEKHPRLHLHCRKMTLPNVSLAMQYMQSSVEWDLSELQSLELAAPLPSHMQKSWDILRS